MPMLMNPADQLKMIQAASQQTPRSPGFSSPWEQAAFQAGGMLGGMAGNQLVLKPQVEQIQAQQRKQQAEQQAQAAELTETMKGTDPAENMSKAAELMFGRGDTASGLKFLAQSRQLEQQKLERDKLARRITDDEYEQNQIAIDNKFKQKRLDIEGQRADAYLKSIEQQSKTGAQKTIEDIEYARNRANEVRGTEPELAAQLDAYANKRSGVKSYSTGGSKGIKQTLGAVKELSSALKIGGEPFNKVMGKEDSAAYARAVANRVNKKEQEFRSKNESFDQTQLVKEAHAELQKYVKSPQGVMKTLWGSFGRGTKEFDLELALGAFPELAEDTKQAVAAPGLTVGLVRNGYVYQGGDPKKKENWTKQ